MGHRVTAVRLRHLRPVQEAGGPSGTARIARIGPLLLELFLRPVVRWTLATFLIVLSSGRGARYLRKKRHHEQRSGDDPFHPTSSFLYREPSLRQRIIIVTGSGFVKLLSYFLQETKSDTMYWDRQRWVVRRGPVDGTDLGN